METEDPMKKLDQLEKQKHELQKELRKLKRKPEGKIGYLLLTLGLLLIALAVYYSHNVSAFIGIALTFWGALFLYIRPTKFIKKEILDSTTIEPLKQIHKLLDELDYSGNPTYISPRTLSGLRTVTVCVTQSDSSLLPTDEELSNEEIILKNPSAIKITPPGLGLSNLIENEMKTNFSTVNLEYLQNNLEKTLVEGLEIAESFEMEVTQPTINVKMKNTIFDTIMDNINDTEKQLRIGDPLSSAIACILARSTQHPITIRTIERDKKKMLIQIVFQILELKNEKEISRLLEISSKGQPELSIGKPKLKRVQCPFTDKEGNKCKVVAFGRTDYDAYIKLEKHVSKSHPEKLEEYKKIRDMIPT